MKTTGKPSHDSLSSALYRKLRMSQVWGKSATHSTVTSGIPTVVYILLHEKRYVIPQFFPNLFMSTLLMEFKTLTVVVSACWYRVICHSQCNAGERILSIVISILSAIQQRPVNRDSFTWNLPKPNAFTACVTVNVSGGRKYILHLTQTVQAQYCCLCYKLQ